MRVTLCNLLARLWDDDRGALIATEYLMLGSILTLGTASGLTAMRNATVNEMVEFGNAVQSISQEYRMAGMSNGFASRAGSSYRDTPGTTYPAGSSYRDAGGAYLTESSPIALLP
jgi:hypothetical protein